MNIINDGVAIARGVVREAAKEECWGLGEGGEVGVRDDRTERIRAALAMMPPETRDVIRWLYAVALGMESLYETDIEGGTDAASELGRIVADFPAEPIAATDESAEGHGR